MTSFMRLRLFSALSALVATALYGAAMRKGASYRTALDHAGDIPLPGSRWLPDPADLATLASQMGDAGRMAYIEFLGMDDWFVLLLLLFFLSVAWMLWRRVPAKWSVAIAVLAVAYAGADWVENSLLRAAFSQTGSGVAYGSALFTSAKWAFATSALTLVVLGLLRLMGSARAWGQAFFLDVPHIIDSLWRRNEFLMNREFDYVPAAAGQPAAMIERPCWRKPPFVFFSVTMVFIAYGPTLDGVCSLMPQPLPRALPFLAGLTLAWLLWRILRHAFASIRGSVGSRFDALLKRSAAADREEVTQRRLVTTAALWAGAALLLVPAVAATIASLADPVAQLNACAGVQFSLNSVLRLAVCLGAILAFAAACRMGSTSSKLINAQALIIAIAAAILWFALATPQATEADAIPYRHVFGALAPAILISLAAAPAVASVIFNPESRLGRLLHIGGIPQRSRSIFRYLFAHQELFVARGKEPDATPSRVLFALIQSVSYRTLQLLLPPSLFAFVAPADWLTALTWYGVALSLLFTTWGNMSLRWRQMILQINRWFLSGTALFVSVFVIVIAGLRIYGVDYVTTILDAAPVGVLFSIVIMSYVLSWLVEYWINRMLAVELLAVLGGDPAELKLKYAIDFDPTAAIRVAREGRELSYHGIGRFLVLGTLVAPHLTAGTASAPRTAFHTYNLLELFRVLSGRENAHLTRVIRYSNLYFYAMNALFVLVFAGFAAASWHFSRGEPHAVVSVSGGTTTSPLKDLAASLIAEPGKSRPAVVVVASGGGTRAALYTSHVLQGLHGLGADADIVLASGVSGGGVALAYFAANYAELTSSASGTAARWQQFRRTAAANLIGDVLEGASEWRIFGTVPLSMLLAESIERHVLRGAAATTMQLPEAPPLILNTAITGHPAEDSELLKQTLDPFSRNGAVDCREAARPYNMMNGGRLIFTDLRNTTAFPDSKAPIPNTRLPYTIVKDPKVSLAHAAALNANFPPIFPNARVRFPEYLKGTPCPERSYYVTDGGAQENLGLVSALYAVQSALADLKAQCASKACQLRSLHFIIAEASGASYDYTQDRGISTITGGSRERMTGGLTNVLIDEISQMYADLGADPERLRFNYLPLPLAFRARGGFGTHWMQAGSFQIQDPRARTPPGALEGGSRSSTTISREELDAVWLALHDSTTPYCNNRAYGSIVTDKVRRWICGSPHDPHAPRDWHVESWQQVVRDLR